MKITKVPHGLEVQLGNVTATLDAIDTAELKAFLNKKDGPEPGFYQDGDGDLWFQDLNGKWFYEIGSTGLRECRDIRPPYENYTLTPIKPRSIS